MWYVLARDAAPSVPEGRYFWLAVILEDGRGVGVGVVSHVGDSVVSIRRI